MTFTSFILGIWQVLNGTLGRLQLNNVTELKIQAFKALLLLQEVDVVTYAPE